MYKVSREFPSTLYDLQKELYMPDFQPIVGQVLQRVVVRARELVFQLGGTLTLPTDAEIRISTLGQSLQLLVNYLGEEEHTPRPKNRVEAKQELFRVLSLLYGYPRVPREEEQSPFGEFVNAVRAKSISLGEVYNINETCKELNVSLPHVYNLIYMGVLWPIRIGRSRYLEREDITALKVARQHQAENVGDQGDEE